MKKVYLGDGVYVCIDGDMFKVTTENGIYETDTIYLEYEVAQALVEYIGAAMSEPLKDGEL